MDRRIRHITAVQVHNLTPFPARDSLASALSQPAEQSQFTSHGHLSDDLDVAMQRKRTRRISNNSHRSRLSDDGSRNEGSPAGGALPEGGRRTSGSRFNFPEGKDHRQNSASGSAPTIRPHRARTNSMASSIRSHISVPSSSIPSVYAGSTSVLTSSFDSMFLNNSQAELETVIESRLVETFITITVPESLISNEPPPSAISPSSPAFRGKAIPSNTEVNLARKPLKVTATSPSDKALPKFRRESATPPRLPLSHDKSASISVPRANGDAKRVPLQMATEPSVKPSSSKPGIPSPQYFSPIHRPSTHPRFIIDASSNHDFPQETICSGSRLKIEVWGKVGTKSNHKVSVKGKERAVEGSEAESEWKILQERDFDLKDLIPLPDPSGVNSSRLPLNSLVITLSPPGGTFYLPPPASSPRHPLSLNDGYASDPELDVRNGKQPNNFPSVSQTLEGHIESPAPISRRRYHPGSPATLLTSQNEGQTTTAGWQDLFKLVTLQSCIQDNQSSLLEVVRGIDKVLGSDSTLAQRRGISEYEARLEELAANYKKVIEDSNDLRNRIQARMKDLRQRKQLLKVAQEQLEQDVESEFDLKNEIVLHQAQQASLRARFGPTRTTLIGILSSIYPIELLSPPDLLYTILDVPLPIPLSSSDPAPPLTLSSHKDINEEAVATALGYAAQVVQLLSAYLGKSLVYPVTCIGSRSLIRDNISAMVGPRMFPLYSKGVDTYRFEYGVFLLNKDIEMLMTDRDLRALDMRHTLPNLKNLLLTLTDGEGAHLAQPRPPDSPMSLASELELASRPDSPVDSNSTTPKASHTGALEGGTPSASRPTTPTTPAVADSSKKPLSFIAFSPFTDFLRARYPSSSRTSEKGQPDCTHVQEPQSEELLATTVAEISSDDEDRKTISGISRGADEGRKAPPVITRVEKLTEDPAVLSTPPLPVAPIVR